MTFETTGKFLIVFVRLILGKKGLTELPGQMPEIDMRHEFDLKVDLAAVFN